MVRRWSGTELDRIERDGRSAAGTAGVATATACDVAGAPAAATAAATSSMPAPQVVVVQ